MGSPWHLVTYSITITFVLFLFTKDSEGHLESIIRSAVAEGEQSSFNNYVVGKDSYHFDLKNPSYLHKMLQVHGNDGTKNSNLKHHIVEYPITPIPLKHYLVAGKLQNIYPVQPIGSVIVGDLVSGMDLNGNWIPSKSTAVPESNGNIYTPYVAIHSFTDLRKFLHHLTDNLKSVRGEELSSESYEEQLVAIKPK